MGVEDLKDMSQDGDSPGLIRASLREGFLAGSPIMAGVAPFGIIYGAAANSLGLSLGQTAGMSLSIFAGASQLVFLDLWGQGSSILVLVLAGLVVNLRIAMYSASISPYLGTPSGGRALLASYLLTDESYGVSMGRFLSPKKQPLRPLYFFMGAGLPTWSIWQISGLAGYLGGALIPESWPLGMAVPLVFMSLMVPMLAKGPKASAALTAMIVAVLSAGLPMNLGLLAAVLAGVIAGLVHSRRLGVRP